MNKKKIEWTRWIPIILIAILLMVVYKTVDNIYQITEAVGRFLGVISPFLLGVLIVYFLYIPQSSLERLFEKSNNKLISRKARVFSIVVIYLLLLVVIVLIITFVLPVLIESLIDLANSLPSYMNNVIDYMKNIPEDSVLYDLNITEALTEFTSGIMTKVINPTVIDQLTRSVFNIAGGVFKIFVSLIVSIYIFIDRERILEFARRLSNAVFKKDKVRSRLIKYLNQINKVLFTFLASKGLDSLINMVSVTSILLVFNVKYAILLGFMTGLFNFIPYLGSITAVIISCAITIFTGGLGKAIQIAIPLIIFQQLDGNLIEPKIMGTTLKISPILVIMAVVTGGAYFGIVGMFLGVPIVTMIKQLLLEYINYSENPENTEPAEPDERRGQNERTEFREQREYFDQIMNGEHSSPSSDKTEG